MKIGYFVQGSADEAFIWGLAQRWCPKAELAPGKFRGSSRESLRREIPKALKDLKDDKECDVLVVLTDADVNPWREVKKQEADRIPDICRHLTVFGVADRNIECWLAIDRPTLAHELGCRESDIPRDDPSSFIKRRFGLGQRDTDRDQAKERVKDFVTTAPMKSWIAHSDSFKDFYEDARRLSGQRNCAIPNEWENR